MGATTRSDQYRLCANGSRDGLRMIDLVVFDLDGTLVDSHRDLAKAANALVVELGGAPLAVDAIVRMVGEGAAVLVRRALVASGIDAGTPGALERFLTLYDGCLLDDTVPYPGTLDMLGAIHGTHRLAILTNKPSQPTARILEGLRLGKFFDPVVGGDTPFGRKPDPAGLLHIVRQAGTTPDRTLLVGDSPADLGAARNAGTAICLARFGFGYTFAPEVLNGSEQIIDAPIDLLTVLQTLDEP
jgi:phosphoglycolate phosphatase